MHICCRLLFLLNSFDQELQAASEHVVNYLDARERPVAGTTYKQLKALVTEINQSGYFDQSAKPEESPAEPDSTHTSQYMRFNVSAATKSINMSVNLSSVVLKAFVNRLA